MTDSLSIAVHKFIQIYVYLRVKKQFSSKNIFLKIKKAFRYCSAELDESKRETIISPHVSIIITALLTGSFSIMSRGSKPYPCSLDVGNFLKRNHKSSNDVDT